MMDHDRRRAAPEPADVAAGRAAPAAAQEAGVWPGAASVAAGASVAQHLPTRHPGTRGPTGGENGLTGGRWQSGADHTATEMAASGAPEGPVAEPASVQAEATLTETAATEAAATEATQTEARNTGMQPAELEGLPVRVRQANLAPQLRTPTQPAGEPAAGPSPEAARNTMAALQLGWQRGRSMTEPADDEVPASQSAQRPGDPPAAGEAG